MQNECYFKPADDKTVLERKKSRIVPVFIVICVKSLIKRRALCVECLVARSSQRTNCWYEREAASAVPRLQEGEMAGQFVRERTNHANYKVMPIGTSRTLLNLLLTAPALSIVR